ncbi:MAG: helix-turn-helix domain-containing protein [Christensenellaceae bacterium]|jgi:putative transposase|nr:helix-turn-helix domain-containing protein [Christensenellaceae bacterium]
MFAKTFGCCRFVYNRMLADKTLHYDSTKESLHPTPAPYKIAFEWLKEVDSLALLSEQLHLEATFKNFF